MFFDHISNFLAIDLKTASSFCENITYINSIVINKRSAPNEKLIKPLPIHCPHPLTRTRGVNKTTQTKHEKHRQNS